jgi:hypothetical protein
MANIISASRRTDIPAFHSEWFMHRLREGFVEVKNPYNPDQVSKISLLPDEVLAIVFWSKHPAPLIEHLANIEKMGHRFYFQFTLNDYPQVLEPNLPPLPDRVAGFIDLSDRIGPRRVVWRYDPVIISNRTDTNYHRRAFENLCHTLGPHTRRVVVSLIDFYNKTRQNLRPLEKKGYVFDTDAADLADMARGDSLEIFTCAQKRDYSDMGISPGRCVDGELIESLWGISGPWKKDPSQRKHCRCTHSRDIGAYNTCRHACPYCYAR